jgi:uncharacterized protein YbcV (DUF1398 family)
MKGSDMNSNVMRDTVIKSLDGTMAFPEIVQTLLAEGVERYHADLVRLEKTFYMPDGATHVERMPIEPLAIGETFVGADLVATIRDSQTAGQNYVDFLRRATAAGSTDYTVYLQGRRAIYFGRKGEYHIEVFPGAK